MPLKILDLPTFDQATPRPPQTGIRRRGTAWIAIVNGCLAGEFSGPGSKAAAIEAAGTNRVLP